AQERAFDVDLDLQLVAGEEAELLDRHVAGLALRFLGPAGGGQAEQDDREADRGDDWLVHHQSSFRGSAPGISPSDRETLRVTGITSLFSRTSSRTSRP